MSRRSLLGLVTSACLAGGPVAGLLGGCGSGEGGQDVQGRDDPFGINAGLPLDVVIFNGGYGDDYAKAHEAIYGSRFPRAKVKHTASQAILDDLKPRFDKGNPPDVVNNDGAKQFTIGTLVNDGAMVDLTELLDSPSYDDPKVPVRDTLMPGTVEAGTFNGKVYALNYVYTVFGLFHDETLWKQNGWEPPKSWEDFLTLAPKIKAAGIAPFAHAGMYPYYMGWSIGDWIQKAGGTQAALAIDNLEPNAWHHDAVQSTIEMVLELVGRGFVLEGSEKLSHTESQQALIDGKVAMLPCGTWLENEMKETLKDPVKLSIAPVWSVSGADKMPFGALRAGAGGAFFIPTMAANKAGGLEYLRIMLSKTGAAKFSELTNSLASAKGSADTVNGSSGLTSASKAVNAAGQNLMSWKFNDWYADLEKEWQGAIADLMSGTTKRPKEFIKRLQTAADAVAKDSSITKFRRDK